MSPAGGVDGLVVVPHAAKVVVGRHQLQQPPVLHDVGVAGSPRRQMCRSPPPHLPSAVPARCSSLGLRAQAFRDQFRHPLPTFASRKLGQELARVPTRIDDKPLSRGRPAAKATPKQAALQSVLVCSPSAALAANGQFSSQLNLWVFAGVTFNFDHDTCRQGQGVSGRGLALVLVHQHVAEEPLVLLQDAGKHPRLPYLFNTVSGQVGLVGRGCGGGGGLRGRVRCEQLHCPQQQVPEVCGVVGGQRLLVQRVRAGPGEPAHTGHPAPQTASGLKSLSKNHNTP